MIKIKLFLATVIIFALAGCGTQNYSDLTACGTFPTSTGDGDVGSRYFVCRNANDGQCYYKEAYSEQIKGCDPEFDKNPYGKEECFESKAALFTFEGSPSESDIANSNDNCDLTTQVYFESKVKL